MPATALGVAAAKQSRIVAVPDRDFKGAKLAK